MSSLCTIKEKAKQGANMKCVKLEDYNNRHDIINVNVGITQSKCQSSTKKACKEALRKLIYCAPLPQSDSSYILEERAAKNVK